MLHILIQLVHVKVPEPLAGVIPDWRVLPVRHGVDDPLEQFQGVFAFDLALDDVKQDVVVYRREKLGNVSLEAVFVCPNQFHCLGASAMNATASDTGV